MHIPRPLTYVFSLHDPGLFRGDPSVPSPRTPAARVLNPTILAQLRPFSFTTVDDRYKGLFSCVASRFCLPFLLCRTYCCTSRLGEMKNVESPGVFDCHLDINKSFAVGTNIA